MWMKVALIYVLTIAQLSYSACPEGEFQHGEACVHSCPQKYLDQVNRTCVAECPQGFYSNKIRPHSECLTLGCPEGKFAANNGSTECTSCSPGSYQDHEQSVSCKKCPEGSHAEFTWDSRKCLPCSGGQYQDDVGQTDCKQCSEGTYQDEEGARTCKKCETNMYQEIKGSTTCEVCPDEKDESLIPDQCKWKECPMGYKAYQNARSGITECEICPEGTYQPDEDGRECIPCPRGYYGNRRGSVRCRRCPVNAWTPTTGMSSFYDCTGPSIQLFNDEEQQEDYIVVYGSSTPIAGPVDFRMQFKYARVLSGKWQVKGGQFYGEGELIKTNDVFILDDLKTKINNEFCYFPLDLTKFSGRINKTQSGAYCDVWDTDSDNPDNYCVIVGKKGYSAPGYPWCLESGIPVSCGIPVCGWGTICKRSAKGHEYRGDLQITDKGYHCRNWHADWPHPNTDYPNERDYGVWDNPDHDYCRNPDPEYPTLFCYTTNWMKRYDDCNVPICTVKDHPRYYWM